MSQRLPLTRWTFVPALMLVLLLAALSLAACGGGDDDDAGDDPPGSSGNDGGSSGGNAGSDDGDDGSSDDEASGGGSGLGPKQAVVTIGDTTYEFDMSIVCIALGGAVAGAGRTADGAVTVRIDVPPEDWESSGEDWAPPSITVEVDAEDVDWLADEEVVASYSGLEGKSQVDSFSTDGPTAQGTATFIDFLAYQVASTSGAAEPDPVQGTFEINCGS